MFNPKSSVVVLEDPLNTDLAAVAEWSNMNKLTLNFQKSKLMIIGSDKKCKSSVSPSVQVMDKGINEVNHFEYLGVVFTSNLKWSEHIEKITRKINKRLGLLKCTNTCFLVELNCYYIIVLFFQFFITLT